MYVAQVRSPGCAYFGGGYYYHGEIMSTLDYGDCPEGMLWCDSCEKCYYADDMATDNDGKYTLDLCQACFMKPVEDHFRRMEIRAQEEAQWLEERVQGRESD